MVPVNQRKYYGRLVLRSARCVRAQGRNVSWYCDFGETHGFSYHTGLVFGIYSLKRDQLLVQGGRYDYVGESFGRARAHRGLAPI